MLDFLNGKGPILKSWFNVFMAAVISSLLTVITTTGDLPLDGAGIKAILISGLIAVLPVIKNYFDSSDPRYGKGTDESSVAD